MMRIASDRQAPTDLERTPRRAADWPRTGRAVWASLALLAVVACGDPAPAPGGPAQAPPPVTVARPLIQPIVEWDRYTGRIDAVEEVDVRARVSGYLKSLHFEGGQVVAAGDLLAVIDQRPYAAALARTQAQAQEARAMETRAEALLVQSEARQRGAQSAAMLARSRLANAKDAYATNAIAREQVDVRESELAQAEAEVESAAASVALARADIATAQAAIVSAETAVAQAQLDLDDTRINAPIAGRVGDRQVTRGNFVQAGDLIGTALTSIVSLDPVHVYFDANERAFLRYQRLARAGDRPSSRDVKNPVYVALVDEDGYPHRGHMDFVDNRIDPNTGTMRGRAILPNPDGLLTPGLFATVRLPGSARYDAVMVPDAAIQSNQASRFVFVLGEGDLAEVRPVTPGPLVDGMRVIRAGLDGSEQVLLSGLQRVRPGSQVSPELTTLELVEQEDGLPNDYAPVPESEWIRVDDGAPGQGDGR